MDIDDPGIEKWFKAVDSGKLYQIQKAVQAVSDIDVTVNHQINETKHKNVTGLILSSYYGIKDVIRWFIDNKADVNAATKSGWRPLHFAAGRGHVTTVDMLCLAGADVNAKTITGETPIHLAIKGNMRDTVRKLISHSASLDSVPGRDLKKASSRGVLPPDVLVNDFQPTRRRGENNATSGASSASFQYDNDLQRRIQSILRSLTSAAGDDSRLVKAARSVVRDDVLDRRIEGLIYLSDLITSTENRKTQDRVSEQLVALLEAIASDSQADPKFVVTCSNTIVLAVNQWWKADKAYAYICRRVKRACEVKNEHQRNAILSVVNAILSCPNFGASFVSLPDCPGDLGEHLFYLLEVLECVDNLVILVDVLLAFGRVFPDEMSSHFNGIVDILVGWCVDESTPRRIYIKIGAKFGEFRHFWKEQNEFTIGLLNNLIDDALKYSHSTKDDKDRGMIEPLVFVFSSILECLVSSTNDEMDDVSLITGQMIVTFAAKTAETGENCLRYSIIGESLLGLIAKTIAFLLRSSTTFNTASVTTISYFTLYLINYSKPNNTSLSCPSVKFVSAILDLVEALMYKLSNRIDVEFLYQLFDPYSVIHNAKLFLKGRVVSLVQKLIQIKSTPINDALYQIFLSDLEVCLQTLVQTSESSYEVVLVQENAFASKVYPASDAEALALFNLLGISLLAQSGSITDLWVYEPAIFHLYTRYLPLLDDVLMTSFPRLHLTMLLGFESVCQVNQYFHPLSPPETRSDTNRPEMFALICRLGSQRNLPIQSSNVLVNFLKSTVVPLLPSAALSAHSEVEQVLNVLVKWSSRCRSTDLRYRLICLLSQIVVSTHNVWSQEIYVRIIGVAVSLLSTEDVKLHHELVQLLSHIPLVKFISGQQEMATIKSLGKSESTLLTLQYTALRQVMSKPPTDVFESCHMRFIFDSCVFGKEFETDDWLRRLFFLCQRTDPDDTPTIPDREYFAKGLLSVCDMTTAPMWFWALWQTVWHCVSNKLKIEPWCKPQETFMAIENTIKSILYTLIPLKDIASKPHAFTTLSWQKQLKQVHFMLLFMDILEKLMYNAIEGAAVSIAAPLLHVRTFFKTNRSTCQEWLNRNRLALMHIARECYQPAVVISHGSALLQMTDAHYADTEEVLALVAQAMRRLGSSDSILGLYEWASKKFGPRYEWLKGLAVLTDGHIEKAATYFETHINYRDKAIPAFDSNNESTCKRDIQFLSKPNNPNVSIKLCCQEILDCYSNLGDYEEMLRWKASLQELTKSVGFESKTDWNQIDYLAKLQKWDKIESYQPAKLDNVLKWNSNSLIKSMDQSLLVLATSKNTNSIDAESLLSQCVDQISATCFSWPACISAETTLNLQKINVLVSGDSPQLVSSSPCGERGLIALNLLRFQQVASQQPNSSVRLPSIRATLPSIKWARKHKNIRLAQSLLLKELGKVGVTVSDGIDNGTVGGGLFTAVRDLRQSRYPLEPLIHLEIECEAAKVLWSADKRDAAVYLLSESMLESILTETGDPVLHATKCELNTKSLLTLFNWLQDDGSLVERLCSLIQQQSHQNISSAGDSRSTTQPLSMAASRLASLSDLTEIPWINGVPLISPTGASRSTAGQSLLANMDSDTLTGRLLLLSSRLSAQRARTWFSLASWCFQHGCRTLEVARQSGGIVALTKEEVESIDVILKDAGLHDSQSTAGSDGDAMTLRDTSSTGISADERAGLERVLGQVRIPSGETPSCDGKVSSVVAAEEEVSTTGRVDGEEETRELSRQLLLVCPRLSTHPDQTFIVQGLVAVWRRVLSRQYTPFLSAAKAYFSFLSVNNAQTSANSTEAMEYNITATLRLLRLLVKHSVELRDTVIQGIPKTPGRAWTGIIPQLLARLNHSELPVRQCMVSVLSSLCTSPITSSLIVYPAVVGLVAGRTEGQRHRASGGKGASDRVPSRGQPTDKGQDDLSPEACSGPEDLADPLLDDTGAEEQAPLTSHVTEQEQTGVRACFDEIVTALTQTNHSLVEEMYAFVEEMGRITVLWDELWIGTLNQNFEDIQRKVTQIEMEIRKVQSNINLSDAERELAIEATYEALLRPTIYTLEKLAHITSLPPETPHERWFQDTFTQLIKDTLDGLKHPENPSQPQSAWQSIRHLYQFLYQRSQKHTGSHSCTGLRLDQISPKLYALNSAVIPMPGLDQLTIARVENSVQILPTKTKPKKLIFVGSNGRRYPYLFKGLEDLHLDERIMQFLNITNHMFSGLNKTQFPKYMARNYSVTPLGPRSGLIQMVEQATPLFTLYKKWQQRHLAPKPVVPTATSAAAPNQQQPQAQGRTSSETPKPSTSTTPAPTVTSHVPRPSDVFFAKLKPALEAHGVTPNPDDKKELDNRKDWPSSVLRQVLLELIEETPADLLTRELWCSALSPLDWWNVSITFSRSMAVMSMIGYILGLGDRHLDNVMVDLCTGEVVHIDYNVCFEKGNNLRVPEKVPFRLTQILQHAMGIGGIEGVFRLSCERTLERLREGSEVLLTLLEAFVYDPLVDWAPGSESGYAGAHYGGRLITGASSATSSTPKPRFLSRRELEHEINWKFLGVRVLQMRSAWNDNEVNLKTLLSFLETVLLEIFNCLGVQRDCEDKTKLYHQIIDYLGDTDNEEKLVSIVERSTLYSEAEAGKKAAIENLVSKRQTTAEISSDQIEYLYHLGDIIPSLVVRLNALNYSKLAYFHEPVRDFLANSGQTQLTLECDSLLSQLSVHMQERQESLSTCLEVLNSYKTIIAYFDAHYYNDSNRCTQLSSLLTLDNENMTSKAIQDVLTKYTELFISHENTSEQLLAAYNMELRLKSIIDRLQTQLTAKLIDRNAHIVTENHFAIIAQIHEYIRDGNMLIMDSVKVVVMHHLIEISKEYIVIDDHQFSEPLTDAGVGQYVDTLIQMTSTCNALLSLFNHSYIVLASGADPYSGMKVLEATEDIYKAMKKLRTTFQRIIIPESVRILSANDPDTKELIDQLHRISLQSKPILDCLNNPTESTHNYDDLQSLVQRLRGEISALLQKPPGAEEQSPGQMLLVGFHILISQFTSSLATLISSFPSLYIPDVWYYVDVFNIATSRLSPLWNFTDLTVNGIYFLGIRAIVDVLHATQRSTQAFQHPDTVSNPEMYPTDDTFTSPINDLINFVSEHVLCGLPGTLVGFMLNSLLESCRLSLHRVVEDNQLLSTDMSLLAEALVQSVSEMFQPMLLGQSRNLVAAFCKAKHETDLAEAAEISTTTLQSAIQRAQKALASFQWLHESYLPHTNNNHMETNTATDASPPSDGDLVHRENLSLAQPSRQAILTELTRCISYLNDQESSISALTSRLASVRRSIDQRMEWAVGANPVGLSVMMSEYTTLAEQHNTQVEEGGELAKKVLQMATVVANMETRRARSSEAVEFDTEVVDLLSKCIDQFTLAETLREDVTPLEMDLVQVKNELLEPGTEDWPSALCHALDSSLDALSLRVTSESTSAQERCRLLEETAVKLRAGLGVHGKLMGEVKTILKTLNKLEVLQDTSDCPVRTYMGVYRHFTESVNQVIRFTTSPPPLPPDSATLTSLRSLCDVTTNLTHSLLAQVYQGLLSMAPEPTHIKPPPAVPAHQLPSSNAHLQDAEAITNDSSGTSQHQPSLAAGLAGLSLNETTGQKVASPGPVVLEAGDLVAKQPSVSPLVTVPPTVGAVAKPISVTSGNKNNNSTGLRSEASLSRRVVIGAGKSNFGTKEKDELCPPVVQPPPLLPPKKNTYAVGVWRRVRDKLSGQDAALNAPASAQTSTPGTGPMPVVDQVDAVIRQSTDLDQLALMYEGWTAWV